MKRKILLITAYFAWQGLNMALLSQTMVTINASQPTALTANAGSDASLNKGQTGYLGGNPVATGGTGVYTYAWSPTTGLSSPSTATPNLTANATATYMLTVTDANGCTATDAVIITVGATSVVNNISQGNITISPNPTTGNAIVELPASENTYSITLLTYDGKLLWNRQIEANKGSVKQAILVDSAAPGIYLLIIKNGRNTWAQKIVKL
jgi:hypothetical protein